MKTKLFVGNLNFDTTEEQLKKLFEPYGSVESVTIVKDQRSGRSKGYGFVQMAEPKDAAMALQVSGQEHMGRDLVVTEAESPGEGRRSSNRRGGKNYDRGRGNKYRGGRSNSRSSYNRSRPERSSSSAKKEGFFSKIASLFGFGAKKPEPEKRESSPRSGGPRPRRRKRYRGNRPNNRPQNRTQSTNQPNA